MHELDGVISTPSTSLTPSETAPSVPSTPLEPATPVPSVPSTSLTPANPIIRTPYDVVYSAFLSKILEDEWAHWEWDEVQQDMRDLLEGAIVWFKFPRTELRRTEEGFFNVLSDREIQILACYMKCEWLNRTILSWENVKPLYEERDFSQANLLDKFSNALEAEKYNALKLERVYYRSRNGKPFDFSRLAQQ